MMGRSVMEYVHVNDQQEFHKHFKDDKGVDVKKLAFRPSKLHNGLCIDYLMNDVCFRTI